LSVLENIYAGSCLSIASSIVSGGNLHALSSFTNELSTTHVKSNTTLDVEAERTCTIRVPVLFSDYVTVSSSYLSVSGLIFSGFSASVHEDVTAGGDASIGNDCCIEQHLQVFGGLSVKGDTGFDSSISVRDDTSLSGNLDVGMGLSLGSDLNCERSAFIGNDLHAQTAVLNQLNISNDLKVGSNTEILGSVSAGSDSFIHSLSVNDNIIISSDLTVEGSVDIASDMSLYGAFIGRSACSLSGLSHISSLHVDDSSSTRSLTVIDLASFCSSVSVTKCMIVGDSVSAEKNGIFGGSVSTKEDPKPTSLTLQTSQTLKNKIYTYFKDH
jgi:predicted acyltransferase (DUF342 family)